MTADRDGAGVRELLADFLGFARARAAAAVALILAGAVLEGAGILMLVPVIVLILGVAGKPQAMSLVEPAFARLGLVSSGERLGAVLAGFALVLTLRFAVILGRDVMLARLQEEFVADLRSRAFRSLAAAPWAEVAGLRQDPVGHALTRDVDRVSGGIGQLVHGGVAAVMLAVQFGLALILAPAVTLMAAALGAGLYRSLRWLRERAGRRGEALTREDLELYQTVGGFLRGLKPAKAHGLERDYIAAFERAARRLAELNTAFNLDFVLSRLILQTAAGAIAILAVLAGLYGTGTDPAKLIVALIILARLYGPLQTIQNSAQGVRHAASGYRGARKLAGPKYRPELEETALAVPFDSAPVIAFDSVTLAGGGQGTPPLLDGVSVEIPAGKVTVLAGDSGAGKSTLCDLAVGLLTPDSGMVRVDGAPLDGNLAARLRVSAAYVGQEPFLLDDSLRQNLVWGCGSVADDAVWEALETVGAAVLARGLEGGLDGTIRAEGTRFSGGERQRLRLARALLRRPRFLILDEATNALDVAAEEEVLGAVLRAARGATVLIVSHRPTVLGNADHGILLEAGRLVESGPMEELLRHPGSRFASKRRGAGERSTKM